MEHPGNALYRKLAFKSRLGFGRYADATVQDLLKVGEEEYLIWVYYNSDRIDFLPEVREAIGITQLIDKPGKNPELGQEIIRARHRESWGALTAEEKKLRYMKRCTLARKAEKARYAEACSSNRHESKKDILRAKNHGTFYKNK